MTQKDKELIFILRKCWMDHPELKLAATRIEKLNAKVEEWRLKYENLLESAFKQSASKDDQNFYTYNPTCKENGETLT